MAFESYVVHYVAQIISKYYIFFKWNTKN